MIHLSDRVVQLQPSATVSIADLASDLRRQGRSVISLAAGQPHLDTPDHIRLAGITAISQGHTQYTQSDGLHQLRSIIAKQTSKGTNLHCASNVIVSTGAKQVIFNAFASTLMAGDEVIVLAPYWISYADIAQFFGAKVRVIPWRKGTYFEPDINAIQDAISKKTKWIVINNPNNPTGVVYDSSFLASIGKMVNNHNILLLSDNIYSGIVHDDVTGPELLDIRPEINGRTLVVNGFSKLYNMTGWRIGYGVGPEKLIAAMSKVQSQSTTNANTISQHAALSALVGEKSFIENNNRLYTHLRDIAFSILEQSKKLLISRPRGAFYLFPSVLPSLGLHYRGQTMSDDVQVCRFLLDNGGVAVVPGSAFGAPGHIRISYACSENELKEGCNKIVAALELLQ